MGEELPLTYQNELEVELIPVTVKNKQEGGKVSTYCLSREVASHC